MNSAACSNPQCSGMINLTDCKSSATVQCTKCSTTIPKSHIETFKDLITTTRMHLDKMKYSNTACELTRKHLSTLKKKKRLSVSSTNLGNVNMLM